MYNRLYRDYQPIVSSSSSSSGSSSRSEINFSAPFSGSYRVNENTLTAENQTYHSKVSSVWQVAAYLLARVVWGDGATAPVINDQ